MVGLIVTFSVAVFAAWLLTPVIGRAALQWSVVDTPDGRRKLHHGTVPLWGGVAVYGALASGLLAAGVCVGQLGASYVELAQTVAIAAGFACIFGCIDDAFRLPRYKLAMQTLSILPIVLVGYYVDCVVAFGYHIELGWLGVPLTVLWLLGCINALNLIDGMDGLASVVGLSTAGMMGLIAANEGHPHVSVIALVLAGALAGFLMHNRPPGADLPRRFGKHGHRPDRGRAGNAGVPENLGHALADRPRGGDVAADVRRRPGRGPPRLTGRSLAPPTASTSTTAYSTAD